MAAPRRRLGQDVRRAELLDAAERLLRRDGPTVRVEDIVVEAKAAKGTFYTCFATWDDMLEEVRARKLAELERALAPVLGAKAERPSVLADVAAISIDFIVNLRGLHEVLFHSAFTQARPLPETDAAARADRGDPASRPAGRRIRPVRSRTDGRADLRDDARDRGPHRRRRRPQTFTRGVQACARPHRQRAPPLARRKAT